MRSLESAPPLITLSPFHQSADSTWNLQNITIVKKIMKQGFKEPGLYWRGMKQNGVPVPCLCESPLQLKATVRWTKQILWLSVIHLNQIKLSRARNFEYRSSQIPQHSFPIIWCRQQMEPRFIMPLASWNPRTMGHELKYRTRSSYTNTTLFDT